MAELKKSEDKNDIDFERIVELISKYEGIKKSGEIKKYNEESTKKDFIQPLFESLGWNFSNRGKSNDSVSAEETISKKRVDYGFRINGIPQFFLEAKSLKEENIQTNSKYVIQAIDYAWMKSCSWAILCNFETIAVYNADWKESNYGNNLFFVLHPNDFLTDKRFTYLSKKAFENNELDKIASEYGKKQLKNPINKQLLQDMIHFREVLSKDIVRNNQDKHLNQDDIDESVQRILDRLIFIRNAEDRGLEGDKVQSAVRQWYDKGKGNLLKEISKIYKDYDDKYNSKLFAHHLCDDLYIDNEALQEVIEGLNQSKDNSYRYDFSIIESDVLGNIYEQYLGNILKSTPKRAKLEESKTHRKEQGIYYTPSYIVDYIVKNTVGEYIKTHTPEEIKKVRILDPACGSGSFLIRAYKELENYWLHNSDFAQTTLESEEFYSKKVEILKNNIFGVDLDPKAVEIAQLNLLLQISERKQRLPILQSNIKVGNSLIDDPSVSDKAFKWEEEFPEIMKEGGFDIVIGNPPYIRNTELPNEDKNYFAKNYFSAYKQYDIFILFFERCIKLLKDMGYLGFITSNKFLASDYGQKLREFILKECKISRTIDVSNLRIFKDASTYPVIEILQRERNMHKRDNNIIVFQKINKIEELQTNLNKIKIKQFEFLNSENYRLIKYVKGGNSTIIAKIKKDSKELGEYFVCQRGSPRNKIEIVDKNDSGSLQCIVSKEVQSFCYSVSKDIAVKSNLQDKILNKHKILLPRTVLKLKAAYNDGGEFIMDRIYYLLPKDDKNIDLKFVTAILNSKLMDFYYKTNFSTTHVGGGYLDLRGIQIIQLPIKVPEQHEVKSIVLLEEELQKYKAKLIQLEDKEIDDRSKFEDKVKELSNKLDEFVYEIYGITKDEKKIIEESLTSVSI